MTDEDEVLDDATELLDPGSVPGMTLEDVPGTLVEELLATEEEDVTELEEATELLLFAEELLDPSLSLRMTPEEEFGATLEEEPSFSLHEEESPFSLKEELATSPTTSQEPSTQFNSRSSS